MTDQPKPEPGPLPLPSRILGVPVYASAAIPNGEMYVIPKNAERFPMFPRETFEEWCARLVLQGHAVIIKGIE